MPIEAARRWGAEVRCWPWWRGRRSSASSARPNSGASASSGRRPRRSTPSTTADWLVAQIQGIAPAREAARSPGGSRRALMTLTGRRDEAIVRLPNALAALATVGLVYRLGRGLGGRAGRPGLGLRAGVVGLLRGRDAAGGQRRAARPVHDAGAAGRLEAAPRHPSDKEGVEVEPPGDSHPGLAAGRSSSMLALGLGFLTKGPVILLMVGLTVGGYLATSRRLRPRGCGCLADGRGLAVFAGLALAWPVPVLLREPAAARVWWLEMAQKTGTLDLPTIRVRESVALDWFWMTLPWTPAGPGGGAWPLRRSARLRSAEAGDSPGGGRSATWRSSATLEGGQAKLLPARACPAWRCWSGRNGSGWPGWRGARCRARSRPGGAPGVLGRCCSSRGRSHAVLVGELDPVELGWASVGASALAVAVVLGAWAWRKGASTPGRWPRWPRGFRGRLPDRLRGDRADRERGPRASRGLAGPSKRSSRPPRRPSGSLDELDEGLWFYLQGHDLAPIARRAVQPGLRPPGRRRSPGRADTPAKRVEQAREQLADWARHADPRDFLTS